MWPGTIAPHVGHMPEKVSKLVGMRINRTVAYFTLCLPRGKYWFQPKPMGQSYN